MRAFTWYAVGFTVLFLGRFVSITALAAANRNTLGIPPSVSYALAAIITPPVLYLFYSVKRYFTYKRAFGIDHFDKDYSEPFVKQGIFRYTDNGMYIVGLMALYLPGLLLMSGAALIAAAFSHAFAWAHYFCTERPDMNVIYGKTPGE